MANKPVLVSPTKKTLAGVLGSAVAAMMLFVSIPAAESGRTVEATVQKDGSVAVHHIAGKQYLQAYLDIVGVPTACDGITKGVKLGMKFTEAQCNLMLEQEVIAHAEPIVKCIPTLYGRTYQVVPVVDLAFNVGTGGVCTSSLPKLFKAGKWAAACEWLLKFNKAGGTVIAGLSDRRERGREVCLTGLGIPGYEPTTLDARLKALVARQQARTAVRRANR